MKVHGYNDFYDGWLARIFGFPLDKKQNASWELGWQTADGTPSVVDVSQVIAAEIALKHIIVE